MPKKKEDKDAEEETENSVVEEEGELEEVLDELELGEIAEEVGEESEDQIIDELEFKTFLQPVSSRAPVLDEIVGGQGGIDLELFTPTKTKEKEDDNQRYSINQTNRDYESSAQREKQQTTEISLVNSPGDIRTIEPNFRPRMRNITSVNQEHTREEKEEKYKTAELKAIEREESRLPFQRKIKYEL